MELDLTLDAIAHHGMGIARDEGRPIFIDIARPPFAAVGERVRVRITRDKGGFAFAEIVAVLETSAHRVTPRCQHYGVCGGCHFQHVDYATQLVYKRAVVSEQLARIGGVRDANVAPTIASPHEWGYRAHITLREADGGRLGYMGREDRGVIAIEECPIAAPELVHSALPAAHTVGNRVRRQIGMDDAGVTQGDPLSLSIAPPAPPAKKGKGAARPKTDDAPADPDDDTPIPTAGAPTLTYQVRGKTFRVTAGGFFQVNVAQAGTLVDLVLARVPVGARALDLYAGVGLFTAFLAAHAGGVTAVEQYAPAVADMRHNLADAQNVAVLGMSVEDALRDLLSLYDIVIIDPPRIGLSPTALERLIRLSPPQIVYVSCDPSTLARDTKTLIRAGYRLIEAQPVDMFPQTYHIETVATFARD
jgi:23S rRNA (uracil1939-C5)-methyltransferase